MVSLLLNKELESLCFLFTPKLMSGDPNFNNDDGPSWKLAVKVWNRTAEQDPDILYKLMELRAYDNDWKANLNIKQKSSLTLENQNSVPNLIRNPQCSLYR